MDFVLPWNAPQPPSKQDVRARLLDFNIYREKFLRVRPLQGGERIPFILNSAQRVLHAKVQDEKKIFGMVRALIPNCL